jgi:DNA-binding NarL/FixJ family response regulator
MLAEVGGAEVTSASATVAEVRPCDVVLVDLALIQDGDEGQLSKLRRRNVVAVALEVPGRPDLAERALTRGVSITVPRHVTGRDLVGVLRSASSGAVSTASEYRDASHARARERFGLTDREATILGMIAAGCSNQQIAARLYLSVNSVKTYVRTAYRKIEVSSRAEAVMWAVRNNLAEVDSEPDTPAEPMDVIG